MQEQDTEGLADELNLIFLVSLLLYVDPDTGALRKAIKGLILATEKAASTIGSNTDCIVDLVFTRFLDWAWEAIACNKINSITPRGIRDRHKVSSNAPSSDLMAPDGNVGSYTSSVVPESAHGTACSKATDATAAPTRVAASLQWLVDVPAGKRSLLRTSIDNHGNNKQSSRFGRSMGLLDRLLETQASLVVQWPSSTYFGDGSASGGRDAGPEGLVEEDKTDRAANLDGMEHGSQQKYGDVADAAAGRRESVSLSMECCREILKATACLMSLHK